MADSIITIQRNRGSPYSQRSGVGRDSGFGVGTEPNKLCLHVARNPQYVIQYLHETSPDSILQTPSVA